MSTKEDKESKEPDYDEDENQLEEKQEKETREQETTNQVFWTIAVSGSFRVPQWVFAFLYQ